MCGIVSRVCRENIGSPLGYKPNPKHAFRDEMAKEYGLAEIRMVGHFRKRGINVVTGTTGPDGVRTVAERSQLCFDKAVTRKGETFRREKKKNVGKIAGIAVAKVKSALTSTVWAQLKDEAKVNGDQADAKLARAFGVSHVCHATVLVFTLDTISKIFYQVSVCVCACMRVCVCACVSCCWLLSLYTHMCMYILGTRGNQRWSLVGNTLANATYDARYPFPGSRYHTRKVLLLAS